MTKNYAQWRCKEHPKCTFTVLKNKTKTKEKQLYNVYLAGEHIGHDVVEQYPVIALIDDGDNSKSVEGEVDIQNLEANDKEPLEVGL